MRPYKANNHFSDNGYWSKAIAAGPVNALPGYILGGLAWFAVPWLCATTMGLAALALESNPVFPTYPARMAAVDVSAGLVLPNAAVALLGKGGAAATLLLIFMAVTSAMSAELIAVSGIVTYDIYKGYINPYASGARLIGVSHTSCVVYAFALAGFSTALHYIGISMVCHILCASTPRRLRTNQPQGYLYLLMGVIVSSAVLPTALTLLWRNQSRLAATLSPPLGLACSLTAWLVTAKQLYGELSVASTGANYPMLAGNVVALLSPCLFCPLLTLLSGPQRYDWVSMREIRKADDSAIVRSASVSVTTAAVTTAPDTTYDADEAAESRMLARAGRVARWVTLGLTLALLILWPMPMYGTGYIFSKAFFTGWVAVAIIWIFCSAGAVAVYPVWEGRHTSARVLRCIISELSGRGNPAAAARMRVVEGVGADGEGKGSGDEGEAGVTVVKGASHTIVEKS